MSGVLLRIEEVLNQMNPSERIVADFILAKPQKTIGLSVTELTEKSGASRSAVIRFCKTLGYKGYRDFMLALAGELAVRSKNEMHEYTDIRVGDDSRTIAKSVCLNNSKAIHDSFSIIDMEQVEEAARVLGHANRIDFYGCGASGVVAMDAQQKFVRINRYATAYQDPHLQVISASALGPEGVAVAISWSGETKETISAASASRECGATLIAITHFGSNHLQKIANIHLQLLSPETTVRCGAMSSRIAQLNMIDIIYSIIVSNDYKTVRHYLLLLI